MYEAHFGLKKPLFQTGIAQESAVFLSARHQQIAASIKLALTTSDSAVVLTGPAGVGKTALTATALRTTSTKLALGWITVAPGNAGELLELLLAEFGFSAHRVGRVERMQMWRQFLNEMSATSSRVYVIAERAEDLGADVLRALDSLTTADPNGSLGANLVLLGQPALLDVLKAPTLTSLCQRIRLRQQLGPLALDELAAYLDQHAKAAGGVLDKLFARDALPVLHEITGGIPRVVNNVAETALTLAATRKSAAVTAQLLREVAQMFGIAPTHAPANAVQAAQATRVAPSAAAASPTMVNASAPAPGAPTSARPVPQPAPVAAQQPRVAAQHVPVAAQHVPVAAHPTPPAQQPSNARPIAAPAPPLGAQPIVARPTPAQPRAAAPSPGIVSPPLSAAQLAAASAVPGTASPPARPTRVALATPAPNPASTMTVARPTFAATPSAAPAPAAPALAPSAPAAATPTPAPHASPSVLRTGVGAAMQPPAPARERQFVSDEELDSFAATLTDSPDVPTSDFPVLTDAVDTPPPRARAETAYVKAPAARAPAPEAPKPAPLPRVVAAASTPPTPLAAKPMQPAPPPAPKPAPPAQPAVSEDADLLRQTATMRAISVAKSIDDISNSMAETLFGDAELEKLNLALAASGWTEDDAPAATPSLATPATTPPAAAKLPPQPPPPQGPLAKPAQPMPPARPAPQAQAVKPAPQMPAAPPKPPADDDPFDFLGLGRDAPLELIDEPVEAQQRKEAARNR